MQVLEAVDCVLVGPFLRVSEVKSVVNVLPMWDDFQERPSHTRPKIGQLRSLAMFGQPAQVHHQGRTSRRQ